MGLTADASPSLAASMTTPEREWRAPADRKGLAMAPDQYRLYRLDGAGMIHDAEWFEAADDAEAEAQIGAMHPNASCEI